MPHSVPKKLRELRDNSRVVETVYDAARKCFVNSTNRRRSVGLTRRIAALCPVAFHKRSRCRQCSVATYRGATRSKVTFRVSNASEYRNQTPHAARCDERVSDAQHGCVVDRHLGEYEANGRSEFIRAHGRGGGDPCMRTLVNYLERERGWRIVATQVPLLSEALHFATAIDLLCTDAATSSELHLIEVKSARSGMGDSATYIHWRSCASGLLAGMPRSRYVAHQLQLWAMARTIEREIGISLDSATVMRTSPSRVIAYPLNDWLSTRDDALVRAFGAISRRRPRKATASSTKKPPTRKSTAKRTQ